MAKDLFIIRHAKSDWSFDVRDFDRPLSARGFRDAPVMAKRLSASPAAPQLLISSPAKRAITTAQIFAKALNISIQDILQDPAIYEAHQQDLLRIVKGIDNAYANAAIFGHNPGFTLLANYLAGENIYNIPTCGIVYIRFPDTDDWAAISEGTGKVVDFAYPKDGKS